jgi:hypothetical protein
MKKQSLPKRLFRCRLEELGPLNDMVQAMFRTNLADFGQVSPEYGAANYLTDWDEKTREFQVLVPTGLRRTADREVTKEMTAVSKSLREPLNRLNIRLNRASKKGGLTVAVDEFGLSKVRNEISTSDMEGLDGALNYLLQLLQAPANATALAAQGHTAADTMALTDARKQIMDFNTTQNSNMNSALELTEENVRAGNALWEFLHEVLESGVLLYKETQPKKAKTFQIGTLMKRVRHEHGGVPPTV